MKKLLLLSLLAIIGFSCKKKDSCGVNVNSISGSYKVTGYGYKSSSSATEIDYYNIIFPYTCQRDDIYTFNNNGTYHIADAGTVCTPNGSDDGTWSLTGNTVTIDGDAASVQSFDCHTWVIVVPDTQVPGDQLRITLTKQ